MRAPRLFALTLASGLAAAGIAGCSTEEPGANGSAPITVTASDTACAVARTEVSAGVTVFKVSNTGSKVTEFYVYATGDRVMGEVENIGPGLSRDLRVELTAGAYETACKPGMSGSGIRGTFTVTGSVVAPNTDAKLAEATASYQRYVRSQTDALLVKTQELVDAVKAGDVEKAKALTTRARGLLGTVAVHLIGAVNR